MIKVLIIGADPQMGEVVGLSIGRRWPDANVCVRTTGAEGLEMVEETSPDVVLLCSSLPDMGLAKAIRRLRRISSVLLLVLGHQGGETEIVTTLQFGADAYVKLPCDMTELMARISCLLRRAGSSMGLPGGGKAGSRQLHGAEPCDLRSGHGGPMGNAKPYGIQAA